LLIYKGLKLNSNEAEIYDELPNLYVDVRYKATIFTPSFGDLLGFFLKFMRNDRFFFLLKSRQNHPNFSFTYKYFTVKKYREFFSKDLLVLGIFNTIIHKENINKKLLMLNDETVLFSLILS